VILVSFLLPACSPGDCTTGIFPSIVATVVEKGTAENLVAIAAGTISQGNRTEAFIRDGDFLSAGRNWSGTFQMEISAPDYLPHMSTVVVPPTACAVMTQFPMVELEPEGDG
jgi:hypothetical protein